MHFLVRKFNEKNYSETVKSAFLFVFFRPLFFLIYFIIFKVNNCLGNFFHAFACKTKISWNSFHGLLFDYIKNIRQTGTIIATYHFYSFIWRRSLPQMLLIKLLTCFLCYDCTPRGNKITRKFSDYCGSFIRILEPGFFFFFILSDCSYKKIL